jgi:hypothetical protein
LVVVTHIWDKVAPELRNVVKYARNLRTVAPWEEAERALRDFLPEAGPPHETKLAEGKVFGLAVMVTTWLFGPFDPVMAADTLKAGASHDEGAMGTTVEGYCVKERKMVIIKDPMGVMGKDGRPYIVGHCPDCGTKIFKLAGVS